MERRVRHDRSLAVALDRLRILVALVVLGLFMVDFTIRIFSPTYQRDGTLPTLLLIITGALFSQGVVDYFKRKWGNK